MSDPNPWVRNDCAEAAHLTLTSTRPIESDDVNPEPGGEEHWNAVPSLQRRRDKIKNLGRK